MNPEQQRYRGYHLVREMCQTPQIIAQFDADQARETAGEIARGGRLLLTGEGSSRLFPAKRTIAHARRQGWPLMIQTEAGRQAAEYALDGWAVLAASNSGKTAEVIALFQRLQAVRHPQLYSLSAHAGTPLESLARRGFVLRCGKEDAVAATKSVVEQGLFYRALVEHAAGRPQLASRLPVLAEQFRAALTLEIDPGLVERVARARMVYWAGRNDGVAEELTLKTNEITRKPADYLEGTYAVHGIEEVMSPDDVVLWVDPYEEAEAKFHDVLVKGVGLTVIAIAARDTRFPTIRIPDAGDLAPFVQLAAGWNLLVEVGLHLNVNLDKPQRARKVGNEYVAS
jgi:glucosamine--fructose-6-phosphate aminotransferase (isomerizing)